MFSAQLSCTDLVLLWPKMYIRTFNNKWHFLDRVMDSSPFSLIARPDNGSYDEEAPQLVMHFDFDHKNPGYLSKSGPFYPSEGLDIFSKANKLLAFLAISRLSFPLSPSSPSSLYHSPPIPYQTASSILYYNHPLTRLQSLPFIFLL